MSTLEVVAPGPLATVQDLGRPGYAHLGVPGSGGADRSSLRLANRLVGNDESAAVIETTLGGFRLRADAEVLVAVTGARTAVRIGGTLVGTNTGVALRAGDELRLDAPTWGLRNYVAVRGGLGVEQVLGSCSTDTLSGLGPAVLSAGSRLPIGDASAQWPRVQAAPADNSHHPVAELSCLPGPRADHLVDADTLYAGMWQVSADSNRVGVRLSRPEGAGSGRLTHRDDLAELRSEGIAHGSVQVPPSGNPVIFLADHPVTGGYPVAAVLTADALDLAAQLVAGTHLRFRAR